MQSRWWAVGLVLFFMVLIVALVAGHSRSSQIKVNGVTFDINAPSETITFIAGGITIQARGHTITYTDGSLTMDSANYGRVGPGDRVTMNDSGAMTVNGKARTPAP